MPFIPSSVSPPGSTLAARDEELRLQRLLTKEFIDADPTEIILTPRSQQRTPSGATTTTEGFPRPLQSFKMVYGGSTGGGRAGIVRTGDGVERMYAFTIIGLWNATIAPGDHWQDIHGSNWEIEELIPHNGYETRATVRSYGGDPYS